MKENWSELMVQLRRSLGAGFLVLTPLLLTLWIVLWFFRLLAGILAPPIGFLLGGSLEAPLPLLGWTGLKVGHLVPPVSILALLLLIAGTGTLARNFAGQRALALGYRLMDRIPVVRRIYSASRQIFDTILSKKKGVFRRAVMFEYPRRGIWSVGFVTADSSGEVDRLTPGVPHYHIFLPTTPNPTSGFMLIIPRQDCHELGMSIEEALKLIISGGAVSPDEITPLEVGNPRTPAPPAGFSGETGPRAE